MNTNTSDENIEERISFLEEKGMSVEQFKKQIPSTEDQKTVIDIILNTLNDYEGGAAAVAIDVFAFTTEPSVELFINGELKVMTW